MAGHTTVYHGSHNEIAQFVPREVSSIDSLGTWFTSRAEYARDYFGPVVHAAELPELKLFEVGPDQSAATDYLRMFGANAQLAERAGFPREAKILRETLPDANLPAKHERMLESDDYETRQQAYALTGKVKAIRQANEAARTLLNSPEYMKLMRGLLEDAGYDGVVFRDSRIDLSKEDQATRGRHDVYVIFHREPIASRRVELTSEVAAAPCAPRIMYHVTYANRLREIAAEGLCPGQRRSIGAPSLDGNCRDRVFLSDAKGVSFWLERGEMFAVDGSDDYLEDEMIPVLLRVAVPAEIELAPDKEGSRDSCALACFATEPIPAECLAVLQDGKWLPADVFEMVADRDNLARALDEEGCFARESPFAPARGTLETTGAGVRI